MIEVINYLKKISYADYIFYFLTLAIFFVFLMPFMHYTVLNLVKVTSGSTVSYFNDTLAANIYLFIDRYYIFYTVLGVASMAIFLNKRIFSEVIELFSSFNLSIRYAIALFFIFGVISSVFAISPSIAFKGVSVTFLQFFCILFIAVYIRDNSKAVRIFLYNYFVITNIFWGYHYFYSYL